MWGLDGLPHEQCSLLWFLLFTGLPCEFYIALFKPSLTRRPVECSYHYLFSPGSWSTFHRKTRSGSIFCWVSNPGPQVSRFSGQGLFSASQSRQRRAHPLLVLMIGPAVLNWKWREVLAEQFWSRGLLSPFFVSLALVLTDRDFYQLSAWHRWKAESLVPKDTSLSNYIL